jgi:hypothetical protein
MISSNAVSYSGLLLIDCEVQTFVPLCITDCGQANQGDLVSGVYSRCFNQIFYDCIDGTNEVTALPLPPGIIHMAVILIIVSL